MTWRESWRRAKGELIASDAYFRKWNGDWLAIMIALTYEIRRQARVSRRNQRA